MAVKALISIKTPMTDEELVQRIQDGEMGLTDELIKKYKGFVILKASNYFVSGGTVDDLIQEGLIGLQKAIHDYKFDRQTAFRSFMELCVTRQIITAIKTASRQKHSPLNKYLSLCSSPSGAPDDDSTLGDILPSSEVFDPIVQAMSREEVDALVEKLCYLLSDLEARVLTEYLKGYSYEVIAAKISEIDGKTKMVDNALTRVKRKTDLHLAARNC